jgi:hypothetical protein
MSLAFPHHILRRGTINPSLLKAVRAVTASGWRITSIYRPTGTHAKGISFDTAPLTFTMGGFGLPTAKMLWRIAKSAAPECKWLANAELDHIHLQIFDTDTLGMNESRGTVLYDIDSVK